MSRRATLEQADAECCEVGLLREELIRHGYYEVAGTRFTLPDGTIHSIPHKALPGTFFEIAKPFFDLGAGLIWTCEACDDLPLSPYALRLYVAAASQQNLLRYGGVDPGVLSFRNGRLLLGGLLANWDPRLVRPALRELKSKKLALRRRATISAIHGQLLRWGFHAGHFTEQNVEIVIMKAE